jgi:hypothetical protein
LTTDLGAMLDRFSSAGIDSRGDGRGGVFLRDPDGHALRVLPARSTADMAGEPITSRAGPAIAPDLGGGAALTSIA